MEVDPRGLTLTQAQNLAPGGVTIAADQAGEVDLKCTQQTMAV